MPNTAEHTLATERWLPVVGHEGSYEVSDLGNVRSLDRVIMRQNRHRVRRLGQLLACPKEGAGYPAVVLCKDGVKRTVRVHVLVLTAFVAPRPAGLYACHDNGDRADNRLDNLRWDTPRENCLTVDLQAISDQYYEQIMGAGRDAS